jgi:hypothetical protein
MGVQYARWLVAKSCYFSPEAASVAKLIDQLRAEKWIVDPKAPELAKLRFDGIAQERARATGGYAVTTVENRFGDDARARLAASTEPQPASLTAEWLDDADREELRLVWPVAGELPLPVRYPLSRAPDGEISYALEVHRALEYVYPSAPTLAPLATVCACGEELAFEWDEEELVPAFDASTGIFAECEACSRTFDPTKVTAVLENPFDESSEEVRGGAAYRFALKVDCGERFVRDASLAFAPELVELIEKVFGRSFHQFGLIRRTA